MRLSWHYTRRKNDKTKKIKRGDTVAIVSLSSGIAGDKEFRHRYEQGKKRLEEVFKLKTVTMPNALKDKNIKGIICNIGGDDTIRLLPYIDFDVIKNNPKVFIGYSDTTINHFMMYKAGITSYYGPSVMCEFAENYELHDYTKKYVDEVLFRNLENITIKSSPKWASEFLEWSNEEYDSKKRKMFKEEHGYEVLQGKGTFEGELLGGCIDVFPMLIGTEIWPSKDAWENKVLFLETCEDEVPPDYLKYYLRNLIAQGIIDKINGIIIGKPQNEKYYEEYKEVYKNVIGGEANRSKLPILYNVNIGHTAPMCIFPLGQKIKVDLNKKEIIFLEKPMRD